MRWQVRASVAVLVAVSIAMVVWAAIRNDAGLLVLTSAVLLGAAGFGWWSLRRGRHVPLIEARAQAEHGAAIVLWKPGCIYCERLLRGLRGREDIAWVNVWADGDANRLVRELNDGDELTPTAVVGEQVLRNPSAQELAATLDGRR